MKSVLSNKLSLRTLSALLAVMVGLAAFSTESRADLQMNGFTLHKNESMMDGSAWLVMQGDGNLVIYDTNFNSAVWYSNTGGHACAQDCMAVFQSDGNLVLYEDGQYYWNTGTVFSRVNTIKLMSSYPYFMMYSDMAKAWAVVPHGNLVWPATGDTLIDTISFQ